MLYGYNNLYQQIVIMLKIASWNINSINSRLEHLLDFLKAQNPDILLLQETKCLADKFPYISIEDCGYNIKVFGQKSYNGVAILSKYPMEDVVIGLPGISHKYQEDARYIEALIMLNNESFKIASVYVPNGSEIGSEKFLYKLEFLETLSQHLNQMKMIYDNIIIGGDLNAPENIDVYNPEYLNGKIGFHIEERAALRNIINQGFLDTFRIKNRDAQEFSWWDYRSGSFAQNKGMRIDHILASPSVCDMLHSAEVYKETRGWTKPSDHAPVICDLKKG